MKPFGFRQSLVCLVELLCAISVSAQVKTSNSAFLKKEIEMNMSRVFSWQVANPVEINLRNNNLWARAVFYAGVLSAYQATGNRQYLEQARHWAESRQWKLGDRPRHADDQSPGQTYLELYLLHKDPIEIANTRETLDAMIMDPKPGREDWWWCDALFMSPPVLAQLYTITKDKKYLEFLDQMWWDATDFLFDKTESLYYRDKNYFNRKTLNGKKIFWARGNGWVMAGTVRVLQHLPKNYKSRSRYIDLLQKMAVSVRRVQGSDGLWRPSLLDPEDAPVPETSSSGFFCYAIAWGINQGYLDRKTYSPVVRKAWLGLVSAIHSDGKLGWVQPIGAAPATVSFDNNQEYGSGAFLLAGSEMLKLK